MSSGKKVLFGGRRPTAQAVDEWVSQGAEGAHEPATVIKKAPVAAPAEKVKMKRLSMDLTDQMHRDLMKYCVDHDTKASILVRELLEKTIYS